MRGLLITFELIAIVRITIQADSSQYYQHNYNLTGLWNQSIEVVRSSNQICTLESHGYVAENNPQSIRFVSIYLFIIMKLLLCKSNGSIHSLLYPIFIT